MLLEGFRFLLILIKVIWKEEQIFAALLLYLAYEELVDGEEEQRPVVDHHILLDSLLGRQLLQRLLQCRHRDWNQVLRSKVCHIVWSVW